MTKQRPSINSSLFYLKNNQLCKTSTLTNPSYQPTSVSYKSSKSIHGLQDQVDDVVQITRNNLILGLERGVKLDVLENRT
ncbi:unnamed protein product, partial [Adineta steineri]